jgi:hypothetical protein
MVAEVPIRDEWIARQPLLAELKGQSIKINIQGTLSNPKIDRRQLQDLGKRVISGATNRLLQDQLNRGLNKLFGSDAQP